MPTHAGVLRRCRRPDCHGCDPRRQCRLLERQVPDIRHRGRRRAEPPGQGPDRRDRHAAAAARQGARRVAADRRSYAPNEVPDVPAALAVAAAWLRETQSFNLDRGGPPGRPWRAGIRPAGGDRPGRARESRALRFARAAASAEQPRADPGAVDARRPTCRRLPASIPPFIAATLRLRTTTPSRSASTPRASGATASTACPTNTSPGACARSPQARGGPRDRRASRQRRLDVRAVGRPQRRKHDGLHRARRAADGHAAGPDRSRASCST